MDFLLIVLADLGYCFKSSSTRIYQDRVPEQGKQIRLFQFIYATVAGLFFLGKAGFSITFTPPLLLIGVFYGLGIYLLDCAWAKALELGSLMLTSIIFNTSLLIPVLYSAVANREGMTALQIIGLVLILVTLFLSSYEKGQSREKQKVTFRWLFFALGTFFCNGTIATLQKVYGLKCGEETMSEFMAFSCLLCGLFFGINFLIQRKKTPLTGSYPFLRRYGFILLLGLAAGVSGMFADGILGSLCVRVPGAILYPCINGGLCVLLTVTSFLFFREKATPQKLAAVATGIGAIIVLNV